MLQAVGDGPNIEPTKTAGSLRVPEGLIANPKARLREQFREACRFKHLSERTEESYWGWVRRFLAFCKSDGAWRHPRELASAEVPENGAKTIFCYFCFLLGSPLRPLIPSR